MKEEIVRPECSFCGGYFRGRRYWYKYDSATCKCGAILECKKSGGAKGSPEFIITNFSQIILRRKEKELLERIAPRSPKS